MSEETKRRLQAEIERLQRENEFLERLLERMEQGREGEIGFGPYEGDDE